MDVHPVSKSDDNLGNQKEWSWNREYQTTHEHANFCVYKSIGHEQIEKTRASEPSPPPAPHILTMIVYSLQVQPASLSQHTSPAGPINASLGLRQARPRVP